MNKKLYNSVNNSLTTGILNFNNPLQVFINLNEIDGNYITNNGLNSNFIINFNVERFGVMSYFSNINYEQINYINKEYNLNSLRIWLTDNNNYLLDNNNWEIFIIIEYI